MPYSSIYKRKKRSCQSKKKGIPFVETAYEKIRRKVKQYTKDDIFIKEYFSIQIASDETNIDRATISKCASGIRKTAGGFKWKF